MCKLLLTTNIYVKTVCKLAMRVHSLNKHAAKMKLKPIPAIIQTLDVDAPKIAANLLIAGQVIAVPTDTIYGLACSANCEVSIKKLYSIKGRDEQKPVAICVSNIDDVRKWGKATHLRHSLLNKLLPGPITIILEKTELLNNPYLNPSTCKIGIRIPDYKFINKVTEIFNMPLALTSANPSSLPSTLSIKEFEQLYPHLGAVFDGGVLNRGLDENRTGSTVVDLSMAGHYEITRRGVSCEMIEAILQEYNLKTM